MNYARKREHKRRLKKVHAWKFGEHGNIHNDRVKHEEWYEDGFRRMSDGRNRGYTYWQSFDYSAMRKWVHQRNEGILRRRFRDRLASQDHEDIVAPKGSEYRKESEFLWEIY